MSDPQKAVSRAMSGLENLVQNIGNLGDTMLEIADEGVDIVKSEMERYNIPTTGDLGNSIKATKVDAMTAQLGADGGHATFVEYGTGIVGANSPHPEAAEDSVVYDRNNHGESGWTYLKDGRFYHTKGQPSRPFMLSARSKIAKRGKTLVVNKLKESHND